MHWINNSACICLTMLSLHFLTCIPLRYCIRICVLKASPHPFLLLRCVLSSLLTTGRYPVALPVCMPSELRPHHVCLWQSVLPLRENESGSSHSKFLSFLLNWPNVGVCVLGGSYITSNFHAFGFSLQFIQNLFFTSLFAYLQAASQVDLESAHCSPTSIKRKLNSKRG